MRTATPRTLATAGHVDHGKTALVGALTGVETDRLPEEQRRGISITCGYAPLTLGAATVAVIDVPGHERFIREMVGGVGGVDAVLLVVAADAGVMPQTREHLAICRFLGVTRLVVALSRADLVDAEGLALADADVAEALSGTPWAKAPRVACSALTGAGLPALRAALAQAIGAPEAVASGLAAAAPSLRGEDSPTPFAMPIDRVFSVRGFGTVVTGTCHAGTIRPGETVTLARPGGPSVTSRVRSLERHGLRQEVGRAGERLALNLPELGRLDATPGAIAYGPGGARLDRHLETFLTVDTRARRPLRAGDELLVQLGFATALGRLTPRGEAVRDGLAPGASGPVSLRFAEAMPWFPGVPVTLRGFERLPGAGLTVAGGRVFSGAARAVPASRRADTAACVTAMARHDTANAVRGLLALAGPEGRRQAELCADLPEACVGLAEARARLLATGAVVLREDRFILGPLAPSLPTPAADAVGPGPRSHDAASTPTDLQPRAHPAVDADAEALAALTALLLRHGLTPPWREALGEALAEATGRPRRNVEPLIARGLRSGALVRVSPELIYAAEALRGLEAAVVAHFKRGCAQGGTPDLAVADLKALAGASRRWAMPLLAWLDGTRVTVREGDVRRLHPRLREAPGAEDVRAARPEGGGV